MTSRARLTVLDEGGTITPVVTRIGRAGSGEWLTLRTEDDDVDMTFEQLGELPVRLTQADAATTRRFGGFGLSMALLKAFSTMLGGDVAVKSHPGKRGTSLLPAAFGTGTPAAVT